MTQRLDLTTQRMSSSLPYSTNPLLLASLQNHFICKITCSFLNKKNSQSLKVLILPVRLLSLSDAALLFVQEGGRGGSGSSSLAEIDGVALEVKLFLPPAHGNCVNGWVTR